MPGFNKGELTCRRCSLCNINYPPDVPFTQCAVCNSELSSMSETAMHQDWQERVKDLLEVRGEVDTDRYPNAVGKIRKHRRSKTQWVKKPDLLLAGYRNIKTFDTVQINGKYYEIQGFDAKRQEYWIEELKDTIDEKDLYRQADGGSVGVHR